MINQLSRELTKRVFINGEYISCNRLLPSYNPQNGNILGNFPECDEHQVDHSIQAAKNAFKSWKKMLGSDRARFFRIV